MTRYDLREVLYKELPPLYIQQDKEAEYALKRFYRVLGGALNLLQEDIDSLFYLYDIKRQEGRILDELAKNMGFEFPNNFTLSEKRLFLYNLPHLLKIKGEDKMYEVLAHIFFYRDATVEVEWRYKDEEEYSERDIIVMLNVPDNIEDFETKEKKFKELAEYFRAINVGIGWQVVLFYDYTVRLYIEERNIDYIDMNDNFSKVEYDKLNKSNLPFRLFIGKFPPEDVSVEISEKYLSSIESKEADEANIELLEGTFDTFVVPDLDKGNISVLEFRRDEVKDVGNLLNNGKLNSTIVLNRLAEVKILEG